MFKRIDNYILSELIPPFIFGVITFSSILVGAGVLFPLISQAAKYGFAFIDTLILFFYQVPQAISITFPMAMLLASLFAFNRLSSDRETIAFRSAGIGFYRLVLPVLFFAVVISLFHLLFNEWVVPRANLQSEERIFLLKGSEIKPKENVNLTEYDSKGDPMRIINVAGINGNKLERITVAEFDNGQLSRIMRAPSGQWNRNKNWELYNGSMHFFSDILGDDLIVVSFEKEVIDILIDLEDYMLREKSVEEMGAYELYNRIQFKKQTGGNVTRDLLNFHFKFALPFASVIFSLLGVCVGFRKQRNASSIGVGVSLLVVVLYYLLYSFAFSLGIAKILPPLLAAWFPNLITGLVALHLARKLAQQ